MTNRIFILVACLVIICYSCDPPRTDRRETLSVSIEPQKYFLEMIVGDRFEINSVIASGSNPETFDPAPAQMITLSRSKAYFKVGHLSFENVWIENIKKNNPELSIIDCSKGISMFEEKCHDHDHSHGHDGADPHIWSSPETASLITKNMYEAVTELDPKHTDLYKKNYDKLLNRIAETDSIIKQYIEKAPSKSFLIYHPALTYFSHQYGLNQLSIEYEGKTPSPTQLKKMIDTAKQNDVKVVFIQKEYDHKNAHTIAKEINAKIVSIDLLSFYWEEELLKIARALALEDE